MQSTIFKTSLTDHCLLQVSGQDAATFLQGQISCDINELSEHSSSLACCCDRKGRVLFSFRIFKKADSYFLYLPNSLAEMAASHLRKFIIIAKVKLTIEQPTLLGFSGAGIATYLAKHEFTVPKTFGECGHNDQQTLICLDEKTPRFLLIGDADNLADLTTLDLNAWQYQEIEQDIVTIYPATQGLFIPQMLDYEKWGALSFTKGCYVGQEIVARTQHLGKLKRHLHRVDFQHEVKLGEEVTHEGKKGVVAAVALNPQNDYAALVVLQDG